MQNQHSHESDNKIQRHENVEKHDSTNSHVLYLEPLAHQVGGHVNILCLDGTSICKPYTEKEHEVYEHLPDNLRTFVPEYRGVIELSVPEDGSGYLLLSAYKPSARLTRKKPEKPFNINNFKQQGQCTRVRLRRSGSVDLESCGHLVETFEDETATTLNRCNSWSVRCHTSLIKKLSSSTDKIHTFLLLENLAYPFRIPCILDLKMGTQQHGDDASEQKKVVHTKKCQYSTSATLGVRMCGMQVYQVPSQTFKILDKYIGRSLSTDGFCDVLKQFLHNGQMFRCDLINPFLDVLGALRNVLEKTDTFRFFSSSLLMLYDGSVLLPTCTHQRTSNICAAELSPTNWPQAEPLGVRLVDARMVDFEHTTYEGFKHATQHHSGPDPGYLKGLDSVISLLTELRDKHTEEAQP